MNGSKRTPEIEQTILRALAVGTPLAVVCRQVGIVTDTWHGWKERDPALQIAHDEARSRGADAIAEQCLEIIDEPPERYGTENGDRIDTGDVAWKRARVETRLKLLACWHPKKYGNRVSTELTGANGGPVEIKNDPAVVAAVGAALRSARQQETDTNGSEPAGG